jgi:hypothetical protein
MCERHNHRNAAVRRVLAAINRSAALSIFPESSVFEFPKRSVRGNMKAFPRFPRPFSQGVIASENHDHHRERGLIPQRFSMLITKLDASG